MISADLISSDAISKIDRSTQATANVALARYGAHTFGKGNKMTEAQIDAASKDFESLFLSQMMEQMFGDSLGEDMFGGEEAGDIYKGMMMEQYGKQMTAAGGIGIAGYVKTELLKLQEVT